MGSRSQKIDFVGLFSTFSRSFWSEKPRVHNPERERALSFCSRLAERFPALEIGLNRTLTHRVERVRGPSPVRILFLSDLHLRPGTVLQQKTELLNNSELCQPDLIVLGGDLIDSSRCFCALGELVSKLGKQAPVLAIAGNHDGWFGVRRLAETITANDGHWLPHDDYHFQGYRVSTDPQKADILVSHYPSVFARAAQNNVMLTLAGHLHGCQFVLAERHGKLYPGGFFYKWNGRRFELGNSSLVVSLGCSDLFPVRWNCPRESVLVEIG